MSDNNSKLKILITGANGQLGMCIQDIAVNYPEHTFHFKNSSELDITNQAQVSLLFQNEHYDYCINCAAYTAVDKAETEKEKAFSVNAEAVKYLAEASKQQNAVLIHISTDFVFDGEKDSPYTEEDQPNPINVYGASKLKGEEYVQAILEKHFIIRTSWVYSEHGNNFVKTMLRLGKDRDEISVVNDQIGSPTYARDLAQYIMDLIKSNTKSFGIKNYSNDGRISWYDFAVEVFKQKQMKIKVNPIKTIQYPTPAKRPKYSILELSLEKAINWKKSLTNCLLKFNEN